MKRCAYLLRCVPMLAVVILSARCTSDNTPATTCRGECLVTQAMTGCQDVVDSNCAYIYRCFSGTDLSTLEQTMGFSNSASCSTSLAAATCTDAKIGAAVREGRQLLDQNKLATCTTTIANAACLSLGEFILGDPEIALACEEVPVGLRALGDACMTFDDCAGLEGYCNSSGVCESRGASNYEIECAAPLAAGTCPGDKCLTFVANQQGLTGTCTRECTTSDDCGFNAWCLDLNLASKLCLGMCMRDTDCDAGLVCVRGTNLVVGSCLVVAQ